MGKSYAETDRRIIGEAYGGVETLENVTTLCDDYDSRWPGSGDDKASCEYMTGKLEGYGLENVHLEKFTIPGWKRGPAKITVLEPRRKEIPCIGLPMTADGKVEGETVVYGAHYEGHDIAVGALDDATGAAVVMETARILAKEKQMKRGMRFLLFGAEEIGLYGSRAYVRDHPRDVEATRFMMNFDAAGRYGKQGFLLHGWPQLEPFFKEITSAIGPDIPLWQGVSPYSDHWPFFLKGVPTAGMGDPEENRRLGGRGFGHTSYDTVDKVNLRAMRECAANASIAAVRIANADDWPVTLRPQKEVEAFVQAQGFRETVELGEKLKAYLNKKRKSLKPETRDYLDRLTGGWDEVI